MEGDKLEGVAMRLSVSMLACSLGLGFLSSGGCFKVGNIQTSLLISINLILRA
jgi:hypothetical protein